jgi:hypothetical protein
LCGIRDNVPCCFLAVYSQYFFRNATYIINWGY